MATVTKLTFVYLQKNTFFQASRVLKPGVKPRVDPGIGYCRFHNAWLIVQAISSAKKLIADLPRQQS